MEGTVSNFFFNPGVGGDKLLGIVATRGADVPASDDGLQTGSFEVCKLAGQSI
jgi:hypothetical protein